MVSIEWRYGTSAQQGGKAVPRHTTATRWAVSALLLGALTACARGPAFYPDEGVKPVFSFAVTDNPTPYSQCLAGLKQDGVNNLPRFAIGEISDKTGQYNIDEGGSELTQGVAEMVMSAFAKTRMARLVERFDLRIPLAELQLAQRSLSTRPASDFVLMPFDFLILGALTELNYNIVSEGASLHVQGVGAGARNVVINVALDLRVIDAKTFEVLYVASLQKQVMGVEVQANIFRFFGNTLVEFDAGRIRNEPLQLGVRSVVEMATYQIMTEFLGLPVANGCELVRSTYMDNQIEKGQGK